MEEELQESSEPIDFTQIQGIVRRRRWQFLVPFFCGWALVWGMSFIGVGLIVALRRPERRRRWSGQWPALRTKAIPSRTFA